jgi:hypothetical protein
MRCTFFAIGLAATIVLGFQEFQILCCTIFGRLLAVAGGVWWVVGGVCWRVTTGRPLRD